MINYETNYLLWWKKVIELRDYYAFSKTTHHTGKILAMKEKWYLSGHWKGGPLDIIALRNIFSAKKKILFIWDLESVLLLMDWSIWRKVYLISHASIEEYYTALCGLEADQSVFCGSSDHVVLHPGQAPINQFSFWFPFPSF